jgi:hypothetical protein
MVSTIPGTRRITTVTAATIELDNAVIININILA